LYLVFSGSITISLIEADGTCGSPGTTPLLPERGALAGWASAPMAAAAGSTRGSGAGRGPTLATSKPFPPVMREGRFRGEELAARSFRVDLEQALEGGARLGAVVVEAGAEEVAIDPDGRYPLASVRKVVTLGGFALAVASGACDSTESVRLPQTPSQLLELSRVLALVR
jgi:hypothetical protein